jgi:hypothetical protein
MDPSPETPQTGSLLLEQATTTAPFTGDTPRMVPAEREQVEVKPLRRPKERPPVAEAVVAGLVMSVAESQASVSVPPTPPAAPAPPAAPPAPMAPTTFDGGADNGTSIPPDTAGAVGPNHVLNPLNNNVWIFNRAGILVAPTVSLNRFWSGLGNTGHTFDPRAVFDPSFGGRYIFATMADAQEPTSRLLIAVSTTNDPTQPFVSHAIQVDDAAQGQVWFDYPSVGFTADKITVQINLFTRVGNNFAGSTIYAIDKASIYNPPHQAPVQRFILKNKGATQVPVVTYDGGVNDQFLVARWSGNIQGQGFLIVYRLSGNVALNSATLTQLGFLGTPLTWDAFPPGDLGTQSGTPRRLNVGDDRILSACVRNGKLYCCHAVMLPAGGPTRSAVQWWEIDTGNWSVLQVGRIDDPTGAICVSAPSLAVNSQTDLLIGHATFSANIHPSGAYMLRTAGAQPQPSNVFAPGQNTYFKTFGGTSNRWGDYSYTQVDPANDVDFWTVQEYAGANVDSWATKWVRIVPPPAAIV